MKRNDTLNYAFVTSYNQQDEQQCYFKNCFFVLEADIINDFTSQSNYVEEDGKYVGVIKGVEPLTIEEFNVVDKDGTLKENNPFASFVTGSRQDDISGIWFYTYDNAKNNDLASPMLSYLTSPSEFNYYSLSDKDIVSQKFIAGHLQLTAPNLISTQNLTLRAGGNEYLYEENNTNIIQGSKYNPYIITSAKDFEEYCIQKGSTVEYYRLVCNIDYESENIYNTKLTNKKLESLTSLKLFITR